MLKYSEYLEWSKDECGELQRSISDKLVSKLKAAGFDVSRFANIIKDLEFEGHSIDMVLDSLDLDMDYENVNKFEILYYIANGRVHNFYHIHRYYSEEYTPEFVIEELEQAERFCEFMNSNK